MAKFFRVCKNRTTCVKKLRRTRYTMQSHVKDMPKKAIQETVKQPSTSTSP